MAYVIKVERRASPKDEAITMWLSSAAPVLRWGPGENAMKFPDKGTARRTAESLKIKGPWHVTEV
jgi:hypothetical protein